MPWKLVTRVVIPVALIAMGVGAARLLFTLAPSAARSEPPARVTTVEAIAVAPRTAQARLTTTGVVAPALEVTLTSEVSGRVIYRSEDLVPGGRFEKGEVLVKLDPRDYELAIRQEKSRVQAAELELEQEKGRQIVAKREWEVLGGDGQEASESLVLRKPHLAAAKEALEAAKSSLDRAKLNLGRTVIRAPFNASVVSEQVEVGQVLSPNTPIATLIGTDRFWVKVQVPVERLDEITLPAGGKEAREGSPATIEQKLGAGKRIEREGRVLRIESRLDQQTRTAQLIVGVDDPLDPPGGGPPLLPEAYVEVTIAGREVDDVFVIPRGALHEGSKVWVADGKDRLDIRSVEVSWSGEDELYVRGELEAGDRVIVSSIALPVEGMAMKVQMTSSPVSERSSPASDSSATGASEPEGKAPTSAEE